MKCPLITPVESEISYQTYKGIDVYRIIDAAGCTVATDLTKQNAVFLSHAINSHDKLVNALDQAIESMGSNPVQALGEWETGMFCGLEDRGITDIYEACRYGYERALAKVQEWIIDEIEQVLKEEKPK